MPSDQIPCTLIAGFRVRQRGTPLKISKESARSPIKKPGGKPVFVQRVRPNSYYFFALVFSPRGQQETLDFSSAYLGGAGFGQMDSKSPNLPSLSRPCCAPD